MGINKGILYILEKTDFFKEERENFIIILQGKIKNSNFLFFSDKKFKFSYFHRFIEKLANEIKKKEFYYSDEKQIIENNKELSGFMEELKAKYSVKQLFIKKEKNEEGNDYIFALLLKKEYTYEKIEKFVSRLIEDLNGFDFSLYLNFYYPFIQDFSNFIWNQVDKAIYGPVQSRRLGLSLGVNLYPERKTCSYNCIYCDVGKTIKPFKFSDVSFLKEKMRKEFLYEIIERKQEFDFITFAGNGEPLLYPRFFEILEYLKELLIKHSIEKPFAIFTNGTPFAWFKSEKIKKLDSMIERIFFKIDTLQERRWKKINSPTINISWEQFIKGLKKASINLNNLEISIAIVNGEQDEYNNVDEIKSDEFVEFLKLIDPVRISFYTIDYPVPGGLDLLRKERELDKISLLLDIGEYILRKTGIDVIIV